MGAIDFTREETAALGHLLSPYKVQLSREVDDSDMIVSVDAHKSLTSPATGHFSTNDSPTDSSSNIVSLPSELIKACSERLQAVMNPRVAFMYKLATRSHFQYGIIPSILRNRFLRRHDLDYDLSSHLALERARTVLKQLSNDVGFNFEKKNSPSLIITHDIESAKGLNKALSLKTVEDKLGVRSTWFLVSDEYPIPQHVAKELGEGSTIGSHDTRHDGKLIYVGGPQALIERLRSSKMKLETIFERNVECFRSPLLQFNQKIAGALSKADYRFDFSIPCWEPIYPMTMSGFGIESVQSFEIDGLTEFPLTLSQDHQVLNVLGMNTREATKLWIEQAKLVWSFDGDVVLLIHPDYAFSQHLEDYRQLLTELLEIHSGMKHQFSSRDGLTYYA